MSGLNNQNSIPKINAVKIFLIAGEPSGDLLGGRLMAALKRQGSFEVDFYGIGGECMEGQGLKSLIPMQDLSIMGIAEIVPKFFKLRRLVLKTANAINYLSPNLLITIDSPGFCFGVLKRVERSNQTRRIHYVAPSVWAWRPGRIKKFAREFDHLLTLLPFEPKYFVPNGLPTTFVGHAVIELNLDGVDGVGFRERYKLDPNSTLLCVLPGSRIGEVRRHLKPFHEAVLILKRNIPTLTIVIPTLSNLIHEIRDEVKGWGIRVIVVEGQKEKFNSMAASNVALAASGTVSLELAMMGVPCVIGYRVNLITSWVVRMLIRVKYANLVNILLDREEVPEFIQGNCSGKKLAVGLEKLLSNQNVYIAQQKSALDAIDLLRLKNQLPSDVAASTVLGLID